MRAIIMQRKHANNQGVEPRPKTYPSRNAESARGVSPRAALRSGLDTLASSGSCHRNEGRRLPPKTGAHPVASWLTPDVDDLPPLLHGHCPASSLLRGSPPLAGASVFRPRGFSRLCLFPWHRRPGSQVPCESPNESHASCTPDTVWPVGRFPPYSSRNRV